MIDLCSHVQLLVMMNLKFWATVFVFVPQSKNIIIMSMLELPEQDFFNPHMQHLNHTVWAVK